MKRIFIITMVFFSLYAKSQMLVYTVAGSLTSTSLGDNGPATNALIGSTEGIWLDGNCNIYITDKGNNRIRKIDGGSGNITTIAGNGSVGISSDGLVATNAALSSPYGLYSDGAGNIYFAEIGSNKIRKIDVSTNIISTFAGGGVALGDNGPATNARLITPRNVYGDNLGNIYIAEPGRIRRVNTSGVITTIVGTGILGSSGDGGPATNANITGPSGMLLDDFGNFFFADRSSHRIRKVDTSGTISTYAGTTDGYSGDGGQATAAQLSGPISFVIDYMGNMVIGDNQNNALRKVDAVTHIITHIGGVGPVGVGIDADGTAATAANIHPEFMYLDRSGNIYYSCFCKQIRKLVNYYPSLPSSSNDCGETSVSDVAKTSKIEVFPNPAQQTLKIISSDKIATIVVSDIVGKIVHDNSYNSNQAEINIAYLPNGFYIVRINDAITKMFVKE